MSKHKEHRAFFNYIWQFGRSIFIKDSTLKQFNSIVQVVRLPWDNSVDTVVDTGWDLPAKSIVLDVVVEVTDASTGAETIAVGYDTDPDDFVDECAINALGFVALAGSDATTLGADLIGADQTGSNVRLSPAYTTAKSIKYQTSADTDDAAGYIYITFMQPF